MLSNLFKKTYSKDNLVKALEHAEDWLNNVTILELSKLIKLLSGLPKKERTEIIKHVYFRDLGYKDDIELLTDIKKLIMKISDVIPELETKIVNDLPESIPLETNDPNINTALTMVSMSTFFAYYIPDFITWAVDGLYLKEAFTEDQVKLYNKVVESMPTLVYFLDYVKADLNEIVSNIGNLPTPKSKSGFMASLIAKFMKNELNVNNNFTLGLTTGLLSWSAGDLKTNFKYNPIYHIRKFLVDVELNKLESLKDKKRLLELKLLELKNKLKDNPNDEKLKKQIEYYEKKLAKTEEKIEAIMDVE